MSLEGKLSGFGSFFKKGIQYGVLLTSLAIAGCGNGDSNGPSCQEGRRLVNNTCVDDIPDVGTPDVYDANEPDTYVPDTNQPDVQPDVPSCDPLPNICFDGDVYSTNTCDERVLVTDCLPDQYCNNAECVDDEPDCLPDGSICFDGDVYSVDTCGNRELVADCLETQYCEGASCIDIPQEECNGFDDDNNGVVDDGDVCGFLGLSCNDDNGNRQIWTGNIDSTNFQQRTFLTGRWRIWSFSPDNNEVVAELENDAGNRDAGLYIINLESGEPRNLSNVPIPSSRPYWSHSNLLYFESRGQIYQIGPDGSDLVQVTVEDRSYAPWVNPSGTKLVFRNESEDLVEGLYITDLVNGGMAWVENQPERAFQPKWVGDRTLAFVGSSNQENSDNLYSINVQNGAPRKLTDFEHSFIDFAFSPNGLVFGILGGPRGLGVHIAYVGQPSERTLETPTDCYNFAWSK